MLTAICTLPPHTQFCLRFRSRRYGVHTTIERHVIASFLPRQCARRKSFRTVAVDQGGYARCETVERCVERYAFSCVRVCCRGDQLWYLTVTLRNQFNRPRFTEIYMYASIIMLYYGFVKLVFELNRSYIYRPAQKSLIWHCENEQISRKYFD